MSSMIDIYIYRILMENENYFFTKLLQYLCLADTLVLIENENLMATLIESPSLSSLINEINP